MQIDFLKRKCLSLFTFQFIDWHFFLRSGLGAYKLSRSRLVITVELRTSDITPTDDKMFAHRQTYLRKAFLLLLLITAGRSAMLSNSLPTAATPTVSMSSLTTQLNNSSMEEPQVARSHRACRSEHAKYCENGGECMYPQDSDEPSCICTSSYSGQRCLFYSDHTRTLPELEQLIGIIFGVAMFIIILGILSYCFVYKRCQKSAPLIKPAASETSV